MKKYTSKIKMGIEVKFCWCGKILPYLTKAGLWSRIQHKHCYSHLLFRLNVLLHLSCLNITATKLANKFLADKPDRAISKNRKASITYYPEFISFAFERGNNTKQIVGSFFYLLEKYALCPSQKTSCCEVTILFKDTSQTGRGKPNKQGLKISHKWALTVRIQWWNCWQSLSFRATIKISRARGLERGNGRDSLLIWIFVSGCPLLIFALIMVLKPNQCQKPRFYLSILGEVTLKHQDVSEIP